MIELHPTECNLCGGKVEYVSNSKVYGRRYGSGWCYLCTECGAYTGTHKPRPKEALGLLADKEMRDLKVQCHALFDRQWSNRPERQAAYKRLADELGIRMADCHFGHFDADMLRRALEVLEEWEGSA